MPNVELRGAEPASSAERPSLSAGLGATTEKDKMEDWASCESRGPIVRNSLKHEISRLRASANRARKAYSKDLMAKPFAYIANAYDEAADALQKRLDAATPNVS